MNPLLGNTSLGYVDINDQESKIVILPNCYAEERCSLWLGPLNNVTTIGCGINVLRFMGEVDEQYANLGLQEAYTSGQGTPFSDIVSWFDRKTGERYKWSEHVIDISTIESLRTFFISIRDDALLPNSCILVKLNRNPDPRIRPLGTTPGHYILLNKDLNNDLWTYEPIYSVPGNCNRRKFTSVSQNFFNTYNIQQGYISASILIVSPLDTEMKIGGGGNNVSELMNEKLIDEFTQDLHTCGRKNGGKRKKTYKKVKRVKKSKKGKKTYKKVKKGKKTYKKVKK